MSIRDDIVTNITEIILNSKAFKTDRGRAAMATKICKSIQESLKNASFEDIHRHKASEAVTVLVKDTDTKSTYSKVLTQGEAQQGDELTKRRIAARTPSDKKEEE